MLRYVVLLMLVAASRAAQVCCPDIGCFTDDRPFNGLPLPSCINDINPGYTMYTRDNRVAGESFDHTSVPTVFDGSRRTAFIVHGYQNNGDMNWLDEIKDALLTREDINVVTVDWSGGSDILNYLQAASNTRTTGAYTAIVIDNLVSRGGGANSRMWCVGHSLGSHVCGHLGMTTHIGRITGMDPAGPSFESSDDLSIGLNPSCADFVDVMHTDTITYGTLRPLGHIDFYPAGGHDQPGCITDVGVCSHLRAYMYFEESVKEDCFQSRSSCDNHNLIPSSCSACVCGTEPCALMGYGADIGCQTTGIYDLDIQNDPPFCEG